MTQEERILSLVQRLETQEKVTADDICEQFGVSRDSARRDLVRLTQLPGIQRIRGGAIRLPDAVPVLSYQSKNQPDAVKESIGRYAAQWVNDGDTLLVDSGTTLTAFAMHLHRRATVITNSLDCSLVLAERQNLKLHLIGGQFDSFFRAVVGAKAVAQLAEYRVNKAFIGVCGLTEHGLHAASEEEAQIKRAMMAQADKVILLCDQKKFGVQHCFQASGLEQIDLIVSDQPPSGDLQQALEQSGVQFAQPDICSTSPHLTSNKEIV